MMPRRPLWLQACQRNCPSRSDLLLALGVRRNDSSFLLTPRKPSWLSDWTRPAPEFLTQPGFTPFPLREGETIFIMSASSDWLLVFPGAQCREGLWDHIKAQSCDTRVVSALGVEWRMASLVPWRFILPLGLTVPCSYQKGDRYMDWPLNLPCALPHAPICRAPLLLSGCLRLSWPSRSSSSKLCWTALVSRFLYI